MSEAVQKDDSGRRSLVTLWLMIAVFAAPVIAAWFFYLYPDYLPKGRTNRGELIEPVVPITRLGDLRSPNGNALDRARFDGRWTLVYLGEGACAEDCAQRLVDLRQIRLALGESGLNVERLLIAVAPPDPVLPPGLAGELEGMQIAEADATAAKRLASALGGGEPFGRVYILDPMGNLMMRYAPDAAAKDTLEDMERLLKASKNWIKGAQYGHK